MQLHTRLTFEPQALEEWIVIVAERVRACACRARHHEERVARGLSTSLVKEVAKILEEGLDARRRNPAREHRLEFVQAKHDAAEEILVSCEREELGHHPYDE